MQSFQLLERSSAIRYFLVVALLIATSLFTNYRPAYATCGVAPSYTSLPNGGTGHTELCFPGSYYGTGDTSQSAYAVSVELTSFDTASTGTCNYRTAYNSGASYVSASTTAASTGDCTGNHQYWTNGTHWSIYGTAYTSSHT